MRLTIVQYAGDYREAFERFERGGRATYQAQRYSVGFVGSLAAGDAKSKSDFNGADRISL